MRKSFDELTIADDFMLFKVGGSNSTAHFNTSLPPANSLTNKFQFAILKNCSLVKA